MNFESLDGVIIMSFQCLHIFVDFVSDVFLPHFGVEDHFSESLEFQVFSWNVFVPAHWGSCHYSSLIDFPSGVHAQFGLSHFEVTGAHGRVSLHLTLSFIASNLPCH